MWLPRVTGRPAGCAPAHGAPLGWVGGPGRDPGALTDQQEGGPGRPARCPLEPAAPPFLFFFLLSSFSSSLPHSLPAPGAPGAHSASPRAWLFHPSEATCRADRPASVLWPTRAAQPDALQAGRGVASGRLLLLVAVEPRLRGLAALTLGDGDPVSPGRSAAGVAGSCGRGFCFSFSRPLHTASRPGCPGLPCPQQRVRGPCLHAPPALGAPCAP